MPYTTNPKLPKLRARAVKMVCAGLSVRQVARYFGFNPSTISRWTKKAPNGRVHEIPTLKSKPKHQPNQLKKEIVDQIIFWRKKTGGRCAEVIKKHLENEGIDVSLNSVKRTLRRNNLIQPRSKWKKWHFSTPRPEAGKPGDLVELDTIHWQKFKQDKVYIYTLIDVNSRWAYARAMKRMSAGKTVDFVRAAAKKLPFSFSCLQSDHGPEFSQHFTKTIGTRHRHSRVRKPNDNAHLERFNRTLQNELLRKLPSDVNIINHWLPKYLKYYNEERLHLGLNLKTPFQQLSECCEGAG
jgi:transposase InsO family protein